MRLDHDGCCEAALDPLVLLLAIKPLAAYVCGWLLQTSSVTSLDVLPQLKLVQMLLKIVSCSANVV